MIVEGIIINELDGLLSTSDLEYSYNMYRKIHNLPIKNTSSIMNSYKFCVWFENKFGFEKGKGVSFLKSKKMAITIGARKTKKSYIDSEIWEYLRVEMFEKIKNPTLYRFEDKFVKLCSILFKDLYTFEVQKPFGNYRVDMYFPDYDLCVEFEEKHHVNYNSKDKERQNAIIELTGARFIRVDIGNEFEGINEILKVLITA